MTAVQAVNRPWKWLAIVLGVVALGLAGLLLMQRARHAEPPASGPQVPGSLERLPARPQDIEAHGDLARSVLNPEDARKTNASVPFATGLLDRAEPFVFKGSEQDRAQALQCLSAAVLYEAGDDAVGEAAVAQVVLNRVRHAAFPATVCGVVYQGSQRATGCQFTFTCDGSLRRIMPEAAWRRARDVARRALDGSVDNTVGLATHYHTNWVYPYWSPQLRKLAQVGTHLFFGWPGGWGGPAAFRRVYRGGEAIVGPAAASEPEAPRIVGSDGMANPLMQGLALPKARLSAAMGSVPLYGNRLKLVRPDERAFGLLAGPNTTAADLAKAVRGLCDKPGNCQVSVWANEDDIPAEYPLPAGTQDTMIYEFVRGDAGKGSTRLDCARFSSKDGACK